MAGRDAAMAGTARPTPRPGLGADPVAAGLEGLAVLTLVGGGVLRLTAEERDTWSVVLAVIGMVVAAVVVVGMLHAGGLSSLRRFDALIAAGMGLTQLASGLDAHHVAPVASTVLVLVGCALVVLSVVRRPRGRRVDG